MPKRIIRKTFVFDAGFSWDTVAQRGKFKLQHNSDPVITSYSYRILRIGDISPNWIEAVAYSKEEAKNLWQEFTGDSVNI